MISINNSKRILIFALLIFLARQQAYGQCSVADVTNPTAICQNITVYLNVSGSVTVLPSDIDNGSTDNCGIDSMFIDNQSSLIYTCANVGVMNAQLTVKDTAGNTDVCIAQITVLDTISPVAVCNSTLNYYLDAIGNTTVLASQLDLGSTDNCGISSILIDGQTNQNYGCFKVGMNVTTLVVTDLAGNIDSCHAFFAVHDTIAPTAICKNITKYVNNNGITYITPVDIDNGSSDNCFVGGSFALFSGGGSPVDSFTCSNTGVNAVQLTYTDNAGNSSSCTSIVTVLDTIPPIVNCQNTTAYLDNTGNASVASLDVADIASSATFDNCGIFNFTINGGSSINYNCDSLGNRQVVVIAEDFSGNTGSCVATVNVLDPLPPVSVCQNITTRLDANGMAIVPFTDIDNGSTDNCGIASFSINGQTSDTFFCANTGINYAVLEVWDLNGNSATCVAEVTVLDTSGNCPLHAFVQQSSPSLCDNSTCNGTALIAVSGGQVPYTFLWNDGNTTANRTGLCPGLYSVIVTDNLGTQDTVPVTINYTQGCVWPGDTDDDALANNFDLLPISAAYGATGLTRPNASLIWQAQPAPDWNVSNPVSGLPDYKHIDCNGDATIDSFDVAAINQNYGQSYLRSGASMPGNIPLYVGSDTVVQGQRIGLGIHLGDSTQQAQDVYAVAFTINYDSSVVEAGTANIDFSNSWLGSDLIEVQKDFPLQGKIEAAVGRTDGQNISGQGKIGIFYITIRDDVLRAPLSRDMPLQISNVRLIDKDYMVIGTVNPTTILTTLETTSTMQVQAIQQELKLFPNPSKGQVNIQLNQGTLQKAQVFSITGQQVREVNLQGQQAQLNLQELASGVYLLAVQTDKGILHQRIVIDK